MLCRRLATIRRHCTAAAIIEPESIGTNQQPELLLPAQLPPSLTSTSSLSSSLLQNEGEDAQQTPSLHECIDRVEQATTCTKYSTYVSLLRRCIIAKALSEGKRIHSLIRKHLDRNLSLNPIRMDIEFDLFHPSISKHCQRNLLLSNLILHLYGHCGALNDAQALFACMRSLDSFSWNFMMKAYVTQGHAKGAVELFDLMLQRATMPNRFIYVTILSVFDLKLFLKEGMYIHARVVDSELDSDMIIDTALVNMYCKCGNLKAAMQTFNQMCKRDSVLWNSIVMGHAQHGHRNEALDLLKRLRQEGMELNSGTAISLLSSCTGLEALDGGRYIHSQIKGSKLASDIVVTNALIAMYGKCGSLEDAESVFEKILHRDRVTFLNIFTACASYPSLAKGKRFHACLINSGLELDVFLGNVLINMYGKCRSLEEAWRVFDEMDEHNVITWNTLIGALIPNDDCRCALQLFKHMHQQGVIPNRVTYLSCLNACASFIDEDQGKRLHASVRGTDFEHDLILETALVHMYGKCKRTADAKNVFDNIRERDVACWNAIITAFAQHDESKLACCFFNQMQQEGVLPDKITFISELTACSGQAGKEGKLLHSRIVCSSFASDIVLGNAIITMYGRCDHLVNAITYFGTMPKRDRVTLINIISACAINTALFEGCRIHASIMGSEFEADVVVANALLNMYGKCGSLEHARSFFNQMSKRNVVSFNAMLSIYAQSGHVEVALEFLKEMCCEDVQPDDVTFVCILSACSHTGYIDKGIEYLHLMVHDYKIAPNEDHLNCMIDMLSRAGRLDEAEGVIKKLHQKPSIVTWTTLLGACRTQADVERGLRAAERVLRLNSEFVSAYVTLSNIYFAAGRESDYGHYEGMSPKGTTTLPCSQQLIS